MYPPRLHPQKLCQRWSDFRAPARQRQVNVAVVTANRIITRVEDLGPRDCCFQLRPELLG